MKKEGRKWMYLCGSLLTAFALWTLCVRRIDVQPMGVGGTAIGFAALNARFHAWTGVHLPLYLLTDWLGLVPLFVCMGFGALGLWQWVKRKRLRLVDADILLLGVYYVIVIGMYLVFEMFPVNYRPILIDDRLEASYPSSTTLLVLSVMPTLAEQAGRRFKNAVRRKAANAFALLFSAAMVAGRLFSGVHWLTDIVGAVLLSAGLFCGYRVAVLSCGG